MEPLTPPQPVAGPAIRIDSHLSGADERSLADDVLDGLTRPFKELPPKHFYDARGAQLFDRICELPEYYPTRAERAILHDAAAELARLTGAAELVELGSGTAAKTRVLLDALHDAGTLMRYVPVDVTERMVRECAEELTDEYPGLHVHGVIGDFERHLDREHEWIEMRLRARREHTTLVRAIDLPVHFDAGEEMRTEISAKFTPARVKGDLAAAGLELVRWFTDPDDLFALTLSRRGPV